jgi:hypothetical protein
VHQWCLLMRNSDIPLSTHKKCLPLSFSSTNRPCTTSVCSSVINRGLIYKDKLLWSVSTNLSGFHQVALWSGLNGLRPQGLKEYSDSYLTSDYLGPVLGSKYYDFFPTTLHFTLHFLFLKPCLHNSLDSWTWVAYLWLALLISDSCPSLWLVLYY